MSAGFSRAWPNLSFRTCTVVAGISTKSLVCSDAPHLTLFDPGVRSYLRLATQTGIRFAVQLPQKAFIERVDSSKIVVECDMQTCCPQSEHAVTA